MKNIQKEKLNKRMRRKVRVRAKVFGTAKKPRLSVFRSLKHISVQLIDDERAQTLVSASDSEIAVDKKQETRNKKQEISKIDKAHKVGELIAKKALDKKIKECVFDKSGYKYHGRVKAVAEAARKAGLKF